MKLSILSVALVTACALLFTRTAQADDLKAMEGTWKVESAEAGGKPVESEDLKEIVVKITGDRYEVRVKDKVDAGTLKLDETQKPKTMDATDTEGLDAGKVVKAIYELTGDTLRVCYTLDGGERPTELATKEGSPVLLLTYKREKKAE
ncbi:MAG: TIGR03067 domain-containing protein [Chthoniobacteraceae bacterium]